MWCGKKRAYFDIYCNSNKEKLARDRLIFYLSSVFMVLQFWSLCLSDVQKQNYFHKRLNCIVINGNLGLMLELKECPNLSLTQS